MTVSESTSSGAAAATRKAVAPPRESGQADRHADVLGDDVDLIGVVVEAPAPGQACAVAVGLDRDESVARWRVAEYPLPVRAYRRTRWREVGDAIIGALIRAGVVPHSYVLVTRGRKTGQLRRTPVTVVRRNDRRWLVAPYGPVSWVHNARAAGRVSLHRRGQTRDYALREASFEEAGPVLKQYVAIARPTRPYFQADKDAPVEEFVAEASRHPVFELTPIQ